MEEFTSIFAGFVKYFFLSLTFHIAMHYPIWLMKGGRWAEIGLGSDK